MLLGHLQRLLQLLPQVPRHVRVHVREHGGDSRLRHLGRSFQRIYDLRTM